MQGGWQQEHVNGSSEYSSIPDKEDVAEPGVALEGVA